MLTMTDDRKDVVVVGGGLAGLAAAAYLARAGRQVTVLEKAHRPGGRAQTRVRQGYFFNQGPHALYAGGMGVEVLDELAVPYSGGTPETRRIYLESGDQFFRFPADPGSVLKTRLLTLHDKIALAGIVMKLPSADKNAVAHMTAVQWINQLTTLPRLRLVLLTLARVATYVTSLDELSAAVAMEQIQLVLADNVRYLDGGWQTLVDGLRHRIEEAGGQIRSGMRVTGITEEPGAVSLALADGRQLEATAVIVATSPRIASRLLPDNATLRAAAASAVPVRAATLDVALRRLPRPDRAVVFGVDRPLYLSTHSEVGKLAPEGGALIHLAKYLGSGEEATAEAEQEMLDLLDRAQPGWREELVTRRFLRQNTVVNCLPGPGGLQTRPGVRVRGSDRVFLAGDWVGPDGWLADGSLASGREAARLVLAQPVNKERLTPVYG